MNIDNFQQQIIILAYCMFRKANKQNELREVLVVKPILLKYYACSNVLINSIWKAIIICVLPNWFLYVTPQYLLGCYCCIWCRKSSDMWSSPNKHLWWIESILFSCFPHFSVFHSIKEMVRMYSVAEGH